MKFRDRHFYVAGFLGAALPLAFVACSAKKPSATPPAESSKESVTPLTGPVAEGVQPTLAKPYSLKSFNYRREVVDNATGQVIRTWNEQPGRLATVRLSPDTKKVFIDSVFRRFGEKSEGTHQVIATRSGEILYQANTAADKNLKPGSLDTSGTKLFFRKSGTDLWLKDIASGQETQLSSFGYYDFINLGDGSNDVLFIMKNGEMQIFDPLTFRAVNLENTGWRKDLSGAEIKERELSTREHYYDIYFWYDNGVVVSSSYSDSAQVYVAPRNIAIYQYNKFMVYSRDSGKVTFWQEHVSRVDPVAGWSFRLQSGDDYRELDLETLKMSETESRR